MRFSKRRRVAVADVVHCVDPWKVGVEGGTIIQGSGRGGGFADRFGGRGGRGRGTVVGREGAVLIRCDRSRTEEVMGARDAVISSLLGTVFATELTESWI